MITVQEALQHIEDNALDLGITSIPLTQAQGRILGEDLHTDRPLPPYNRVTMDGIAINYEGYSKSNGTLLISELAPAGAPQATMSNAEDCIEVMTGAVLPKGTDTVIKYEDLEIKNGYAKVKTESVVNGMNVHKEGSDIQKNQLLIQAGTRIGPQEIGIAASIGKHELLVKKNPKTIILSTGDELVEIDKTPKAHQIRRSNTYTIASILFKWRIEADQLHLPDDKQVILNELTQTLENYDLVILIGGVSKGKFDFIPKALKELGTNQLFHKLKQRPGKPLWFGRKNNTIVFGLPGNPVSSFACARKYIYQWLQLTMKSKEEKQMMAKLASDVTFKPDLHYYLPVYLYTSDEGTLLADPYKGNGSGDFANLKNINALMELPRGKDLFSAGEVYPTLLI